MLPSTSLSRWQWTVSILLLLATMINYMDRQVLANMAVRIQTQLKISDTQYGNIEWAFGTAFAVGSLFFGFLVDRVSVRWLYPTILFAWSMVGFATGFVWDYSSLLVCRTMLGFFEAGHWPCALVVTFLILSKEERAFGNSILQSGASIGAILTPIIIAVFFWLNQDEKAWRPPFQIVGLVGVFWVVAWYINIPARSLERVNDANQTEPNSPRWFVDLLKNPRFWALVIMVISINTSWQLIRAWLPKFLVQGRDYSQSTALYFNSAYYLATDVGCIGAGLFATWLSRTGLSVHGSRVVTYTLCCALACLTCAAANLPQGWLLLIVLLVVGAGTLGLFPCYYSFTQELSVTNLGKVTGILSFLGWIASSPVHRVFGSYVDKTKSYDLGIALVGVTPVLGLIAMLTLWPIEKSHRVASEGQGLSK